MTGLINQVTFQTQTLSKSGNSGRVCLDSSGHTQTLRPETVSIEFQKKKKKGYIQDGMSLISIGTIKPYFV